MKKIKKLSVVIVALAVCMLFGSVVWAESGSTAENVFSAVLDKTSICVSDQAQTVTVTIKAPSATVYYGTQGVVDVNGWAYTLTHFPALDTTNGVNGNTFTWVDMENANSYLAADGVMLKLTVTVPANAPAGTYDLGLSELEYISGMDVDQGTVTTASATNVVATLTISEHAWGAPSYEDNDDGTHTATYTCTADATHTKSDAPAEHSYTLEGGTKCVCDATKPVTPPPATGLKGDVNLDGSVTAADLTLLARHIGGIELITNETALVNANVNGDGSITAADLTKLARYVGGIITDWSQN